jgi:hypothetical protein
MWACGLVLATLVLNTTSWLDHCHRLLDCGLASATLLLTTTCCLELYPRKLPIGHLSKRHTFISTCLMEPCLPLATSFAQRMELELVKDCGLIVVRFSVAAAMRAAVLLLARVIEKIVCGENESKKCVCYLLLYIQGIGMEKSSQTMTNVSPTFTVSPVFNVRIPYDSAERVPYPVARLSYHGQSSAAMIVDGVAMASSDTGGDVCDEMEPYDLLHDCNHLGGTSDAAVLTVITHV